MTPQKLIQEEILPEMFRRVGLPTDSIKDFVRQTDWFLKCSWTVEDQADFQEWLTKLLKRKLKLHPVKAEKEAAMFILGYAWTTKKED